MYMTSGYLVSSYLGFASVLSLKANLFEIRHDFWIFEHSSILLLLFTTFFFKYKMDIM